MARTEKGLSCVTKYANQLMDREDIEEKYRIDRIVSYAGNGIISIDEAMLELVKIAIPERF